MSTKRPTARVLALALLAASPAASAWAQLAGSAAPSGAPSLDPNSHAAPAPAAKPSTAPGAPALQQSLSLAAGTGVLLHLTQPAGTVLSADPTIARVQPASPTSLFLMGVAQGQTTVIATDRNGVEIEQFDIRVTPGLHRAPQGAEAAAAGAATATAPATVSAAQAAAAQSVIAQSVQGALNVHVRATGDGVLLTGTVPTAMAAQNAEAITRGFIGDHATLEDQLTTLGSLQVNVRVRIAEIQRQITRQLGFNWQALGAGNGWQFGLLTGAATAGAISPLSPLGLTALTGAVPPYQLGAGVTSKHWDANGIIDALAADQLITILAEPNLTAQSGETASFLAGGEFPIPVAGSTSNGATQVTVDFKEYGVSLALVPTVLSPTRLNLRIRPEVSQLSTNGAVNLPLAGGTLTIPALTVRRAETTVELGSGQSFAIAGLLQRSSTNTINALPGVGELPVLGALFKSNDFQRGESELVIIVTPYVVQPAPGPDALHAPTDHFVQATDLQRLLFGRMGTTSPASSNLDAGFILK